MTVGRMVLVRSMGGLVGQSTRPLLQHSLGFSLDCCRGLLIGRRKRGHWPTAQISSDSGKLAEIRRGRGRHFRPVFNTEKGMSDERVTMCIAIILIFVILKSVWRKQAHLRFSSQASETHVCESSKKVKEKKDEADKRFCIG